MQRQTIEPLPSSPNESRAMVRELFWHRFFAPIDIAPLVFFRIAFGAIMLWEIVRYFSYGWIRSHYIDPVFHFTYYGFGWVRPLPGDLMYLHYVFLGVLALFITLGLWYRVSTTLFFLGITYVFLLDQTYYLNHFYLICLISFLLIFVPAHRAFSIDSLWRPNIRSDTAPAWALGVLCAQMAIVYIYGGVAKLYGDWLRGEPMRTYLSDEPYFNGLLTTEWMAYLFSYGGLLFDLLVVPLLLWRRTRLFAFAAAILFHVTNSQLFNIGIFPWFALAATLLFFPPSWFRRISNLLPSITRRERQQYHHEVAAPDRLRPQQIVILALLALYFAWQILMPMRPLLYPGDSRWTEEAERFSWRMMLRHKESGAMFFVYNTSSAEMVAPEKYLNPSQVKDMSRNPDMVLQFSHFLADELREPGQERPEVYAVALSSLNGRKSQLLVDPKVDLAAQPRTLMPAEWIVPLHEPLPTREQRTKQLSKH